MVEYIGAYRIERRPDAPAMRSGHWTAVPQRALLLGAVLMLVISLVIVQVVARQAEASDVVPLRIAVSQPEVSSAKGSQLQRVAATAEDIVRGSLSSSRQIEVFDHDTAGAHKPGEVAALAGAEKVIQLEVTPKDPRNALLTLRCYGRDGSPQGKPFQLIIPVAKPRQAESELKRYLYARFRPWDPRPTSGDGTPEDRDALMSIRHTLEAGQTTDIQPDLDRLEAILKKSPGFLDAELLTARYTLNRFRSTHDPKYLKRAREIAVQAVSDHPDDRRALTIQLKVAAAAGDFQHARALLDKSFGSDDPENMVLRAELESQEGDLPKAIYCMQRAVERASSWYNRYWLADYLTRAGRIEEARKPLDSVLSQWPENKWALELKAYNELLFGEPSQAVRLYRTLVHSNRKRAYYTNLGMALVLQDQTEEADHEFLTALQLESHHPAAMLNVAEQELKLGRGQMAARFFAEALDVLKEREAVAPLDPGDEITKALCLVRSGKADSAVGLAENALLHNPENPSILQSAAQIYALTGNRERAVRCAQEARQKGMSVYWFKLPAFDGLRHDSEFQKLLSTESRRSRV
jgi:tetratricopeptide (TPR) repeat protein